MFDPLGALMDLDQLREEIAALLKRSENNFKESERIRQKLRGLERQIDNARAANRLKRGTKTDDRRHLKLGLTESKGPM
jgi:hypothetical protein